MPEQEPLNVVGICGSLRRESLNRRLLTAISDIGAGRIALDIAEIRDIPLFDEDVEAAGDPEPVRDLKRAIGDADALLIATPEYQHGLPGVLKNALDWASRPAGESVLNGMVAAIVGATPGVGGTVRAQMQLRQTLEFTDTLTVLQPEVLIAEATDKLTDEGRLADPEAVEFVDQLVDRLVDLAHRMRREPSTNGA